MLSYLSKFVKMKVVGEDCEIEEVKVDNTRRISIKDLKLGKEKKKI